MIAKKTPGMPGVFHFKSKYESYDPLSLSLSRFHVHIVDGP